MRRITLALCALVLAGCAATGEQLNRHRQLHPDLAGAALTAYLEQDASRVGYSTGVSVSRPPWPWERAPRPHISP